jgi:hypothetical protein
VKRWLSTVIPDMKWQRIIVFFFVLLIIFGVSWGLYLRIAEGRPWHLIMGLSGFTAPDGVYNPAKTLWVF